MDERSLRQPMIKEIGLDEPWNWLAAGWRDMWRVPSISFLYGLAVALISAALTAGLFSLNISALALSLAAGFMLIGPLLAVGLYEASRRLETGEPVSLHDVILVSTRSPLQLVFLGLLLMLALLAWLRVAMLLFALFFGLQPIPPIEEFLPTLLFTWHGLALLAVGTGVGGVIAFGVYMISVVSVPMLMAEDRDAMTAVITSIRVVLKNPKPMILWAWLIALLLACGLVTGYLGLIVTFPLVGHATWHAYRAVIEV
jgi:uncharacterized membrane protein